MASEASFPCVLALRGFVQEADPLEQNQEEVKDRRHQDHQEALAFHQDHQDHQVAFRQDRKELNLPFELASS